jgi:hypothetical protein
VARNHAQILSSIWDSEEFCARSAGAQRTFFMLLSQSDIYATGHLSLTIGRWSQTVANPDLDGWLAELSQHRYVVIDKRTEEVLVRTFMRYDKGYTNVKRLGAIKSSARLVRSGVIRAALIEEAKVIGDQRLIQTLCIEFGSPIPQTGIGYATSSQALATSMPNQTVPGSTYVTTEVPGTGNLEQGERSIRQAETEPPLYCSKHPNGTEAPCGPCGAARKAHKEWLALTNNLQAIANLRARQIRDACQHCHGTGWLNDPETDTNSRCSHIAVPA